MLGSDKCDRWLAVPGRSLTLTPDRVTGLLSQTGRYLTQYHFLYPENGTHSYTVLVLVGLA